MTAASARELDELRGRVDRIDDAIADLLAERLGVVAEIAWVKRAAVAADGGEPSGLALRPGREAEIVRRLVARSRAASGAEGRFPGATLVRLWRELLAAMTRVQAPFAVCVHVPPERPELWDMARDHFGSITPLRRAEGAGHALRLAEGGAGGKEGAHVAVLPLPGEADRWWGAFLDAPAGAPRVVARLPFAALPGYPEDAGALVVAALPPEATGDDLTLLAIETDGGVSSARVRELLAPLGVRVVAGHRDPGTGTARHLVELAGLVEADDPRVRRSLAPAGGRALRVAVAGCYARPLSAAELA